MRRAYALAFASLSLSFAAVAAPPSQQFELPAIEPSATLSVPAIDRAKAFAQDERAPKGRPLRYAIPAKVDADARDAQGKSTAGAWQALPDGRVAWRLAVRGPGARTLDFGFERMFLPRGAELYVTSLDGKMVRGPYTEADNTRSGAFWTPYVEGDTALIEAVMPAAMRKHFVLELGTVHSGYRDLFTVADPFAKSLSCNIDTACPDADPFRDQVRAVALITISGSACTGQLLNTTAQSSRRLLSTANHCLSTNSAAASLVAYWRYESPTCRPPGSAQSGTALPRPTPQTGGATLLATHAGTDATLVELNTGIPASAQPYFLGWDRRTSVPPSTAIIHHPDGDEKRISLDFDPPVVNSQAVTIEDISWLPNASFNVTYDRATTEGGSSGGALLSNERRFIGQLGGGPPGSCSAGITDTYGRFAISWEGGGAPTSRFRDHLDPGGTGAQTLDGKEVCAAPTVALTGPASVRAGEQAPFAVTVTGGQGPYTVAWDVDGDGTTDRTTSGVGSGAAIAPVYPNAGNVNVVVRVTDAANCPAQSQRAVAVTAPIIASNAAAPMQVCGDGDGAIEPGERFRIPVTLTNEGGQALQGGFAVFAREQAGAGTGYVQTDSTTGSTCPFQFVDIGASAPLSLTASDPGFPASDDGRTTSIPLPGTFSLFGQPVSSVVMSTNGYLSTGAGESGGDYDNACPVDTPDRGSSGARFNVLHDDLAVRDGGGLRTQHFANCPRPADSAAGGSGCTVFQWNNMARVTGDGSGRDGDFTLQAILYDGTGEVVYQYRSADPLQGGSATIGVQNDGNTVRVQYGCNDAGRAAAGRAVCFFEPNALPSSLRPAPTRLLTPAVSLGNLGTGQVATVDAQFEVDATAACGAPLSLDYVGTVDDVSHTLRGNRILSTTVGGGGPCQVFTGTCPAVAAPFAKRDGLYSSLVRFGNGMGAFNIPVPGGTVFGGQWYTGKRDRTPEWLILQGDIVGNQADVPVYRFRQTGTNPFAVASTIVGRAQISYTSASDYIATWTVDGVAAGEKLTLLYGTNRPTPNRTGSWFPPSESGWGMAIDDHFLPNGQSEQVIVNYFYDAANNPVWTLGGGAVTGGTQPHNLFRVHCPSCPSLPDMLNDIRPAGTVTTNYTGITTGTYSTAITFPAPIAGSWNRSNLPIQMISPPQSPAAGAASDAAAADDDAAAPAPAAARGAGRVTGTTRSRTRDVIR
ncbi:MAG TPA: PKD domain-containing protein [Xanthomonadales bacterium]|nr:PKD domain-containing protein [Xanthomonadales bacterium]